MEKNIVISEITREKILLSGILISIWVMSFVQHMYSFYKGKREENQERVETLKMKNIKMKKTEKCKFSKEK